MFLIDRARCPRLVQGLRGGYRFSKMKGGQRKPTPDKNSFSHPMDGLQYACLAAHGGMVDGLIMRKLKPTVHAPPRFGASAWT